MQLVVFAGQSNALGFGMTQATLPAHFAGFNFGQTYIWSDLGYWGVLQPGVNTGTPANPQAWGPEAQFAYNFRQDHPDEILLIVKSAKGSTSLAAQPGAIDWSPGSAGEMFDLTTERIAAARASIGAPDPAAVFWMQGENDALSGADASAYAANLTEFLAAVRADWMHDPAGYVGLGRIGDSPALTYGLAVRQAQWQLDQVDASAESFKTIGFAMQADGIHLAAGGQVSLGDGYYDNWAL